MWRLLEHRNVEKQLAKAPVEVRKKYQVWQNIIFTSGPEGLRVIPGFHDEALRGELVGYRSSRLNLQWRVIYRVTKATVTVDVERITPHEYRH